ncbi:MAG: dTDP-4-dehydrorhamnose reductase [Elusimicrobiota bacterium]
MGANGQLGCDLTRVLSDKDTSTLTHDDIEIGDYQTVKEVLGSIKPEIIINTAAYHNVEECEKNELEAFRINSIGAKNLAVAAESIGATLIHISTDYVFDGKKNSPYIEHDTPNPLNTYGLSKLAGECYIRNNTGKYFIIRTTGLYGMHQCRAKSGNFIDTMLRLAREKKEIKVVNDQILSPTYTLDLAHKIAELADTDKYGLYHIVNSGFCSWYDFAKKIFEYSDIKADLQPVRSDEFPSSVKRPSYSVLDSINFELAGIGKPRKWTEALMAYIEKRRQKNDQ